jgi:Flp pilus assembly protein TadD
VALDPDMPVGYETLAAALAKAGRQAEAQTALQRAQELRAEDDGEEEDE